MRLLKFQNSLRRRASLRKVRFRGVSSRLHRAQSSLRTKPFHFGILYADLPIRLQRNVFSRRCPTTQGYVSSGMAISASQTVTTAAVDGISPLTEQSVRLQQPLMV